MVVFICNACGQSVKKNQVEKHYKTTCRQCDVLSCIDCGKDFHGEEYATHTSCISEAEKYQGKLYKAKDKQNKGEQKQQAWIKHVQNASSGISDPRLAGLIEKLSAYDNIPRKRAKFENFCKNSIGVRDASLLPKLWEVFSAKPESPTDEDSKAINGSTGTTDLNSNVQDTSVAEIEVKQNKNKTKKKKDKVLENGNDEEAVKEKKSKKKEKKTKGDEKEDGVVESKEAPTKKKKKEKQNGEMNGDATNEVNDMKKGKKRKNESAEVEVATKLKKKQDDDQTVDAEETEQITQTTPGGKFKWDSVIKKILKGAEDNEMKVKKLRKKVLAEFQSRGGDGKDHSDNELLALFDKKINNNPKFKVHKERVSLKR